jgi:hypothetical protein
MILKVFFKQMEEKIGNFKLKMQTFVQKKYVIVAKENANVSAKNW